jgi:DNA-binding transcriptional LysR family regulator
MTERDGSRADWDDLKIFVAAAQTGSFGGAARRLQTTQPTITRRIDDLEVRLGARLFDRGLRGVSLTRAGELVYDRALTMQRASSEIERLVLNSDKVDAGRVTVAATEGMGGYVIGPETASFLRENPSIELALDCGFYAENPVDSHVDLSVQFTDAAGAPELTAKPLATLHYALFASPAYLSTYGAPTRLEEAVGHRFIEHTAQTSARGRWEKKTFAFHELSSTGMVVNSSTALVHAVKAGAGIAALPTAIVPLEPDLVMLDIPPLATGTLWLCHHRDALKTARVQRVADWLTSIFDARERPWFRPEFVHPSEFQSWAWPRATAQA